MKPLGNNILVVIPAYNEEKYINAVLHQTFKYTDNILVIDDGSSDDTSAILKQVPFVDIVTNKQNQGYGQTLIDGFRYAILRQYQWVVTMDCDFQHEPDLLPNFSEVISKNDADIISGSRYMQDKSHGTHVPHERYVINKTITSLLNSQLNMKLTDSFCGFKAYRTSALVQLNLTEKGYAFPLQFWVQSAIANLKITEIPVPLIYIDPKRCFGNGLDEPEIRLNKYIQTIYQELANYENYCIR